MPSVRKSWPSHALAIALFASCPLPGQTGTAGPAVSASAAQPAVTVKKAGKKTTKKEAAAKTTYAVTLPTAHAGEDYGARVQGVPGLDFPGVKCGDFTPARPQWLSFTCDDLHFSGKPTASQKDFVATIPLTDPAGHTVRLTITLPVHEVEETVMVTGAKSAPAPVTTTKPAPAQAAAPAPATAATPKVTTDATPAPQAVTVDQFRQLQIAVTSQVNEGTQTITGELHGMPANASPLTLRAWRTPLHQLRYLAPLSGNTNTVSIKSDGPLSLQLATPLAAGEKLELELLPPAGSATDALLVPIDISGEIPAPTIRLTTVLREGSSTISGTVLPVPIVPTGVTTILPMVQVWTHDPTAGPQEWVSAAPASNTANPVQVNANGAFSVQLATPLAAGQFVVVRVMPQAGHYFAGDAQHDPPLWRQSDVMPVYSALQVTNAAMTSALTAGTSSLNGTATPTTSTETVNVALVDDTGRPGRTQEGCVNMDQIGPIEKDFLPLTNNGASIDFVATQSTGTFAATLASPLVAGTRFHVLQIFPAGTARTAEQNDRCKFAAVFVAKDTLDWGRVHADFSAGVLISNDSGNSTAGSATAGKGNFSEAHQFYGLVVEKFWALPGCYLYQGRDASGEFLCADKLSGKASRRHWEDLSPEEAAREAEEEARHDRKEERSGRGRFFVPGISTFFETRLTAIPVDQATSTSSTTTTTAVQNVLTSAQTARVATGVMFPWLVQRWTFDHRPNALVIAPMAKVGFDTVTGPTTIATTGTSGTPGSQTLEQLYNFWGYGARVAHMELSHSMNKAPETYSYLDILIGPFSNLQSFICHSGQPSTPLANSSCGEYTQNGNYFEVDSRKRLYRLDLEGMLKIPRTIFYVGFNANIGQRSFGVVKLDHAYAAPDDLRFFFGAKVDIASVLSKLNFGGN